MRALLSIIGLSALGLFIYSNSFQNAFHFDDFPNIINNIHIKNIHNVPEIWHFWPTRFVNFYSLALNYHWGGLNVTGYHAVSLLVHIGSSLLVCWLAMLTLRSSWAAFFAGAIFLTHPLQTQAVNYLTQRSTLLAAFFYLASLTLYIKTRLSRIEHHGSPTWRIFYLGSLLSAALALFSKETTVTLPLMICFYELYFTGNAKAFPWKFIAPFIAIACLLPLTWQMTNPIDLMHIKASMVSYADGIPVWQYLLTELKVMATYLRLLFVPAHQCVDYHYPLANSPFEIPVLLSACLLTVILYSSVHLQNKSKVAAFGVFWFFITLLPESSLWPNKDVIFEHRLYLPMAGFSLFCSGTVYALLKTQKTARIAMVLCSLIGLYSVLTYARNKVWLDEFSLWDNAIHQSPNVARAYLNRGVAYARKGSFDLALADFNKALDIGPEDAIVYSNRGAIKKDKGDLDGALLDLNRAVAVNPSYAGTYFNRGILHIKRNEFNLALTDLDKALTFNPDYAEAYNNQGTAYQGLKRYDEAITAHTKALTIDPKFAQAYLNRAVAYFFKKEYNKSWDDLHAGEALGLKGKTSFIENLRQFSKRQE